jgi:pyrroline-5-carboxylate reductase
VGLGLISFIGRLIKNVTIFITERIMGAIAVSKKEEEQIEKLRKELGISTKSGLIRAALKVLERQSREEKLRREIQESVRRCAAADREENQELSWAGVGRKSRGE